MLVRPNLQGAPFSKSQKNEVFQESCARFYFQLRVGVAVFINLPGGCGGGGWCWPLRGRGSGTGGGRLLILGQDLRPLSERDGCRGEGPDTCCKQNAPPKKKKRKTEQQQQIDPILNIFPLLLTDTNKPKYAP